MRSGTELDLREELVWVINGSWGSWWSRLREEADRAVQRLLPAVALDASGRTRTAGGSREIMEVDRVGEEAIRC